MKFSGLLHLPVYPDSFRDMLSRSRSNVVWLRITCSKRKLYTDKLGWPRVYDPRQAKATDICNINIRYLQHLMANIIFGHDDSQSMCRKVELFLLWCALTGTHVDIGVFIIRHLVEVAKTTYKNVIGMEGPSPSLPKPWAMRGNLTLLSLTFWVGTLM